MHPDAIRDGLRRELDRLNPDADDYKDRKSQIEAEIDANETLPRPTVTAEDPETTIDRGAVYLEGLRRELARTGEDRRDEIQAEIDRVEKETRVEPSPEEIEQRKQARTGRKVERVTAAPGEERGDRATEETEASSEDT